VGVWSFLAPLGYQNRPTGRSGIDSPTDRSVDSGNPRKINHLHRFSHVLTHVRETRRGPGQPDPIPKIGGVSGQLANRSGNRQPRPETANRPRKRPRTHARPANQSPANRSRRMLQPVPACWPTIPARPMAGPCKQTRQNRQQCARID
jgi:hypothetical protein